MSETTLEPFENKPHADKHMGHRRMRQLIIFTLILLALGIGISFLYFTKWQFEVETEDAYVNGKQTQITAQISGQVVKIAVDDTDNVTAGDLLLSLDRTDAELALEKAKSDLVAAVRQFNIQRANIHLADMNIAQAQTAVDEANAQVQTASAQVEAANIKLQSAQNDYARRRKLAGTNAISDESISHAKDAVTAAQIQVTTAKATLHHAYAMVRSAKVRVDSAQAQKRASLAMIGNDTPLEQQPAVQAAISAVRNAWLTLQRTDIRAPISGQIARRNVQLGQKIAAGTPLMAVVPLQELWVDANFKESQLKDLRIGQKVTLTSDLYGEKVVFNGIIQGVSAGTGSAFSVLPAQNATGNWIKVVQRVPVRITLDTKEIADHPLRVGLSMKAKIDTREHTESKWLTRSSKAATMEYTPDFSGANEIIDDILHNHK